MKECRYCRTKYDDNFAVCPNCGGAKVVTEQELAEEEALIQRETEYRERANAVPEMRKRGMIGILAVAIVCLIVAIASVSYNANKPLSNGMSKDEGEEILAEGIAHFGNGDYELAMECFQQLPSDSKQYEEAQSMLQKSKDSYRSEILNRVDSYIENGEYDSAFNLISQARGMLPEDSELQNAYDKAHSAYQTSVLEQVGSYVASEQYEIALEYLSGVQAQYPNDTVLQDTYNSTLFAYQNVVRSDAMQQADEYVANGDYVQAISVLESAEDKIGQDGELVAQLNVYKDTYKNEILRQADNALKRDGYEAAIEIIRDGFIMLPEDNVLEKAMEEYKTYAPVYLIEDIDYLQCDNRIYIQTESITDNKGVEYVGHETFHNNWLTGEDKILFEIDKNYSTFSGTIILPYDYRGTEERAYISIYGDDDLLYQSDAITMGFETDIFKIDITGVSILEIRFANGNGMYDHSVGYLTNAYLTK